MWNFAYDYRDLRDINENTAGNASRNNPVKRNILENVALDRCKIRKRNGGGWFSAHLDILTLILLIVILKIIEHIKK